MSSFISTTASTATGLIFSPPRRSTAYLIRPEEIHVGNASLGTNATLHFYPAPNKASTRNSEVKGDKLPWYVGHLIVPLALFAFCLVVGLSCLHIKKLIAAWEDFESRPEWYLTGGFLERFRKFTVEYYLKLGSADTRDFERRVASAGGFCCSWSFERSGAAARDWCWKFVCCLLPCCSAPSRKRPAGSVAAAEQGDVDEEHLEPSSSVRKFGRDGARWLRDAKAGGAEYVRETQKWWAERWENLKWNCCGEGPEDTLVVPRKLDSGDRKNEFFEKDWEVGSGRDENDEGGQDRDCVVPMEEEGGDRERVASSGVSSSSRGSSSSSRATETRKPKPTPENDVTGSAEEAAMPEGRSAPSRNATAAVVIGVVHQESAKLDLHFEKNVTFWCTRGIIRKESPLLPTEGTHMTSAAMAEIARGLGRRKRRKVMREMLQRELMGRSAEADGAVEAESGAELDKQISTVLSPDHQAQDEQRQRWVYEAPPRNVDDSSPLRADAPRMNLAPPRPGHWDRLRTRLSASSLETTLENKKSPVEDGEMSDAELLSSDFVANFVRSFTTEVLTEVVRKEVKQELEDRLDWHGTRQHVKKYVRGAVVPRAVERVYGGTSCYAGDSAGPPKPEKLASLFHRVEHPLATVAMSGTQDPIMTRETAFRSKKLFYGDAEKDREVDWDDAGSNDSRSVVSVHPLDVASPGKIREVLKNLEQRWGETFEKEVEKLEKPSVLVEREIEARRRREADRLRGELLANEGRTAQDAYELQRALEQTAKTSFGLRPKHLQYGEMSIRAMKFDRVPETSLSPKSMRALGQKLDGKFEGALARIEGRKPKEDVGGGGGGEANLQADSDEDAALADRRRRRPLSASVRRYRHAVQVFGERAKRMFVRPKSAVRYVAEGFNDRQKFHYLNYTKEAQKPQRAGGILEEEDDIPVQDEMEETEGGPLRGRTTRKSSSDLENAFENRLVELAYNNDGKILWSTRNRTRPSSAPDRDTEPSWTSGSASQLENLKTVAGPRSDLFDDDFLATSANAASASGGVAASQPFTQPPPPKIGASLRSRSAGGNIKRASTARGKLRGFIAPSLSYFLRRKLRRDPVVNAREIEAREEELERSFPVQKYAAASGHGHGGAAANPAKQRTLAGACTGFFFADRGLHRCFEGNKRPGLAAVGGKDELEKASGLFTEITAAVDDGDEVKIPPTNKRDTTNGEITHPRVRHFRLHSSDNEIIRFDEAEQGGETVLRRATGRALQEQLQIENPDVSLAPFGKDFMFEDAMKPSLSKVRRTRGEQERTNGGVDKADLGTFVSGERDDGAGRPPAALKGDRKSRFLAWMARQQLRGADREDYVNWLYFPEIAGRRQLIDSDEPKSARGRLLELELPPAEKFRPSVLEKLREEEVRRGQEQIERHVNYFFEGGGADEDLHRHEDGSSDVGTTEPAGAGREHDRRASGGGLFYYYPEARREEEVGTEDAPSAPAEQEAEIGEEGAVGGATEHNRVLAVRPPEAGRSDSIPGGGRGGDQVGAVNMSLAAREQNAYTLNPKRRVLKGNDRSVRYNLALCLDENDEALAPDFSPVQKPSVRDGAKTATGRDGSDLEQESGITQLSTLQTGDSTSSRRSGPSASSSARGEFAARPVARITINLAAKPQLFEYPVRIGGLRADSALPFRFKVNPRRPGQLVVDEIFEERAGFRQQAEPAALLLSGKVENEINGMRDRLTMEAKNSSHSQSRRKQQSSASYLDQLRKYKADRKLARTVLQVVTSTVLHDAAAAAFLPRNKFRRTSSRQGSKEPADHCSTATSGIQSACLELVTRVLWGCFATKKLISVIVEEVYRKVVLGEINNGEVLEVEVEQEEGNVELAEEVASEPGLEDVPSAATPAAREGGQALLMKQRKIRPEFWRLLMGRIHDAVEEDRTQEHKEELVEKSVDLWRKYILTTPPGIEIKPNRCGARCGSGAAGRAESEQEVASARSSSTEGFSSSSAGVGRDFLRPVVGLRPEKFESLRWIEGLHQTVFSGDDSSISPIRIDRSAFRPRFVPFDDAYAQSCDTCLLDDAHPANVGLKARETRVLQNDLHLTFAKWTVVEAAGASGGDEGAAHKSTVGSRHKFVPAVLPYYRFDADFAAAPGSEKRQAKSSSRNDDKSKSKYKRSKTAPADQERQEEAEDSYNPSVTLRAYTALKFQEPVVPSERRAFEHRPKERPRSPLSKLAFRTPARRHKRKMVAGLVRELVEEILDVCVRGDDVFLEEAAAAGSALTGAENGSGTTSELAAADRDEAGEREAQDETVFAEDEEECRSGSDLEVKEEPSKDEFPIPSEESVVSYLADEIQTQVFLATGPRPFSVQELREKWETEVVKRLPEGAVVGWKDGNRERGAFAPPESEADPRLKQLAELVVARLDFAAARARAGQQRSRFERAAQKRLQDLAEWAPPEPPPEPPELQPAPTTHESNDSLALVAVKTTVSSNSSSSASSSSSSASCSSRATGGISSSGFGASSTSDEVNPRGRILSDRLQDAKLVRVNNVEVKSLWSLLTAFEPPKKAIVATPTPTSSKDKKVEIHSSAAASASEIPLGGVVKIGNEWLPPKLPVPGKLLKQLKKSRRHHENTVLVPPSAIVGSLDPWEKTKGTQKIEGAKSKEEAPPRASLVENNEFFVSLFFEHGAFL